jgi:hypothetical protein
MDRGATACADRGATAGADGAGNHERFRDGKKKNGDVPDGIVGRLKNFISSNPNPWL